MTRVGVLCRNLYNNTMKRSNFIGCQSSVISVYIHLIKYVLSTVPHCSLINKYNCVSSLCAQFLTGKSTYRIKTKDTID